MHYPPEPIQVEGDSMRSRRLLLLLVLGFLAINFPVLAQSAKKAYRLGILSPGSGVIERMSRTTVPELAKLGFSEGLGSPTRSRRLRRPALLPRPHAQGQAVA